MISNTCIVHIDISVINLMIFYAVHVTINIQENVKKLTKQKTFDTKYKFMTLI